VLYYSVKDIVGVVVFLMIFSAVVFFAPAMSGYFLEHANFIEAREEAIECWVAHRIIT
jgi:ubiquinol-cytochrome c reductase cytochrome b subunit